MVSKLYSKSEVAERLDFREALETVERTYLETARGRVLSPAKLTMHMGDDGEWPDMNAFAIDMPAYVDWLGVAGMKWAIATWDVDKDIPISSLILLFDPIRGEFTAVMEGMHLTGVRTALQSVVGLRHLRSSQPESIGVFGAGFQAQFQLSVINDLLNIGEFRLFDIDDDRAHDLAQELGPRMDAKISICDAPAVAGSDAVVTVTDSKTPVLEERWLDDAGTLIALGSYQELPDETIHAADQIIVDHVEQCLQRGTLSHIAARGTLGENDIDSTIGEVLNDPGYSVVDGERVVFVPIGLGSLDVAVAERVYRNQAADDAVQTFRFE